MRFILIYPLLLFVNFLSGQILPERPATALNKVILYPDSTFFTHSNTFYEEGTLFEIISETRYEYEDEAQNQKFKWYQVNTPDNKTGWIYGDGIAIMLPESNVIDLLKPYHLQTFNFSDELEEAITWIAAIEGKDNFHKEDYLNPLYKEQYLVITSQLGKSFHIDIAGESAMGSSEIKQFLIQDLTADNIPELLLVRNSFDNESALNNKDLEIYTFQAGSISKIFEEKMNLNYGEKMPSPTLSKFVEINEKTIRFAYINYTDCSNYSLHYKPNEMDKKQEKCLEYTTYSYIWNAQQKKYIPFYEESKIAVEAKLKPPKGFLRSNPSYLSEITEKLTKGANLKIIQQYKKRIRQNGIQKIIPYLYVQSENGNYGYIHAKDVLFQNQEHSNILNEFYQNPSLNLANWKVDTNFLNIKINEGQEILSRNE